MRSPAEVLKAAQAQVPSADYIPFSKLVTPGVCRLRGNGELLSTWKLQGITFETSDPETIAIRKEGLRQFLHSIAGGHYAVWSHKIRRVVTERLPAQYANEFCQKLNDRYYASFDAHRQMRNELYLTIVYRPVLSKARKLFKRLTVRSLDAIREAQQQQMDVMEDLNRQVMAALQRYDPERLETYEANGIVYSSLLEFLGFLVNGSHEQVPLQRSDLAEYLPTSRLFMGDQNGTVEIWHPRGRRFAGLLDIKEYPSKSSAGMSNGLLYAPYEYVETQSFSLQAKPDAMKALERQKGHLMASEDASVDDIAAIDEAMAQVQGGDIDMGEYHYSLAVFGDSPKEVADHVALARECLAGTSSKASLPFTTTIVDAIPECAWFAQLPGNWWLRPREATITSRNFAALSCFHNFASGKRDGNPWGTAVALFKTSSGQPYYFNFHISPDELDSTDEKLAGNTFICGTTGAGKTVAELFLMSMAQKYPGIRTVHFDKDRGAEIAIRAMGGRYFQLERGVPTGFAPLQSEPTLANVEQVEKLLHLCAGAGNPDELAQDYADLSRAVRSVMLGRQFSRHERSLTAVWQQLPARTGGNSLRMRLKRWIRGEPLGWVFDNPVDLLDLTTGSIFGFDYTEFLDDPTIRTPVMSHLLHSTRSLLNGDPFMYYMEEFWKPLQDATFEGFAHDEQKTIRKKRGLGVFVTQSPSDVLQHSIGKTMVEQSVTQIYLPNPRASEDDYIGGFKVTREEFKIITSLGEASRMALVKQGHRSVIVQFNLAGMTEEINVLSGSEDNVRLLDELRSQVGDDPSVWMPLLHRRIAERRKRTKS